MVDPQLKVAYLSEQANRFLRLHTGELSAHLLDLVLPELRLSLRAALAHAQQSAEAVKARRVRLQRDAQASAVNMTVRPVQGVHHAQAAQGWLAVLFEETALAEGDEAPAAEAAEAAAQAEREVLDLHEQLSAAIAESDSSNVYYASSTMVCTPCSLSQEVGLALGAQAGELRLRQMLAAGGFSRLRRACETPFDMVLEARP